MKESEVKIKGMELPIRHANEMDVKQGKATIQPSIMRKTHNVL